MTVERPSGGSVTALCRRAGRRPLSTVSSTVLPTGDSGPATPLTTSSVALVTPVLPSAPPVASSTPATVLLTVSVTCPEVDCGRAAAARPPAPPEPPPLPPPVAPAAGAGWPSPSSRRRGAGAARWPGCAGGASGAPRPGVVADGSLRRRAAVPVVCRQPPARLAEPLGDAAAAVPPAAGAFGAAPQPAPVCLGAGGPLLAAAEPMPASGQSLSACSETSRTKATTAAATSAVPDTAPAR